MLNIYQALAPMILYACNLVCCAIPTILRSVDLNITWIEQILIKLGSYFKIFTLNHLDIILFGNYLLTNSHILLMSVFLYIYRTKKNVYVTSRVFSLRNTKHKLWNKYIRRKPNRFFALLSSQKRTM